VVNDSEKEKEGGKGLEIRVFWLNGTSQKERTFESEKEAMSSACGKRSGGGGGKQTL